jgi:CMP-N-acetylneuraminic acid synthetase
MTTVAIIPARGGSKGLPRKNLRIVGGMSLVERAVRQAQAVRMITDIIVSTDDGDIARVAERSGARVIERPPELATDHVATLPVLQHVLRMMAGSRPPQMVVTLQPTSPLRTSEQIDAAIPLLTSEVDAVVGVCRAVHSPYKMYTIVDERLYPLFPAQAHGTPRQNLPVTYSENGAIYVTWTRIVEHGSVRGDRSRPFIMDEASSLDIDTEMDLVVAEALLSARDESGTETP